MKKLIIFLVLIMNYAMATPVAKVLITSRKVIVKNKMIERLLIRGSLISIGETIVTTAEAFTKIKYTNGTIVTIGPDSIYSILSYAPSQSNISIKAELKQGKILSESTGAKRQSLKTPIVSLAILGTVFKAYVACNKENNQNKCKRTYVELIRGKVTVGDRILEPGESVLATSNGVANAIFPETGTIRVTPEIEATSNSKIEANSDVKNQSDNFNSTNGTTETSFVSTTVIANTIESTSTAIIVPQPIPSDVANIEIICSIYH